MLDSQDFEVEDAAPIDMLEAYYTAHGWSFESHDDEIVATVKGSWTEYELRALWREDDQVLQFLAFPDIKVTDDRRASTGPLGLLQGVVQVQRMKQLVRQHPFSVPDLPSPPTAATRGRRGRSGDPERRDGRAQPSLSSWSATWGCWRGRVKPMRVPIR